MLLSYTIGFGDRHDELELCLVPDKPDLLAKPIPIHALFPSRAGVVRVGPDESLMVVIDSDGALVVTAIMPASIYLTPNLPSSPGFRVKRIKFTRNAGDAGEEWQTFYDRDKGNWEEWVANKER